MRIIGLSATIPNIDEMADWIRSIRELPVEVIQHEQRPVPLRNWVFHAEMGAVDLPQLRRQAKGRRKPRKWERHRGRGRHHRAKEHAALLDHIEENELLPCLYFSFSRRECEERAEENARRNLLTPGERDEILKSFDSMCDLYQLEGTDATNHLRNLAGHGILYHHAGLLPVHKEIVERLFTTGLIKLLFTTETFALGVNMPARTVGFASLKKFDGISVGWLMAREYGQMAGRAGRQGIDSVGDVFSRVEDRDLDFRALEHLFSGEIEPVRSRFNMDYATLLNLYDLVGDDVVIAYRKSFARFQRIKRDSERGGGRKRGRPAREEEVLRRRLNVLRDLGYIKDGELTPKGRFAASVQGYEVHAAEFLESGLLHACDAERLVLLFCSIVFEERRGDVSD
ncbi:MAG: helicase-related protein, partial [Planctomycetota bacterium]